MTHLKIEQNNGITEQVSPSVIEKLYEIVHSGNLDSSSNLMGSLNTTSTYLNYVDYLEELFTKNGIRLLIITANKLYIYFADPEVNRVFANRFGDNTGVTKSDLSGITKIPNRMFEGNTTITSFNELGNLTNIIELDEYCFNGATNLSSIDLSNIEIVRFAALNNVPLEIINLPKATSVGSGIGINGILRELNIGSEVPDNLKITSIPDAFLRDKVSVTSVTGLKMVTEIGSFGFGNTRLLEVDTTSNLTTIGEYAFWLTNIKCIDLSGVTTLSGGSLFDSCSELIDLSTSDPTLINTGAATYTLNWSTIPTSVFAGDPLNNKSFVFPNATLIKQSAFNSTKIVAISAPSVTSLEALAFKEADQLVSVNFPNVSTIGNNCFLLCTSLSTIDISSAESIGSYAFNQCSSLHLSISLLNCIFIANDAFRGSGITSFSALNLVTLQGGCFRDCTSLLTVVLSNNLTDIGNYIFYGCSSLTSISLPDNLTSIKECAFYECTNLTSISIPSTVTSLGNQCFRSSGLTSITIPSAVTKIGVDAFTSSLLTSITFEPNSQLTLLRGGCFNGCKFTTIDIPDSCTTMESNVFINMSTLTSIIIGTGIQSINRSFTNSSNYILTIKATTPPSFVNTNCRKPIAIYVPSSSVSAYLSADGWNAWADVIQAISTT